MTLDLDRDLVRRDDGLLALGTLLDPDAFVVAVNRALRAPRVASGRLVYLRYKPGTNCLAAYRLEVAGGEAFAYAKAYHRRDIDKYRKALERLGTEASDLGVAGLALDDVMTVVHGFPNDRVLSRLPRLFTSQGRRARFLERVLPDRTDLWGAHLETVRYKAERRFVGRLDVGGRPRALLKLATDRDFARAHQGLAAVAKQTSVAVPAVLGRSKRSGALVTGWLEGTPLDALGEPRVAATRLAGQTLARLHRVRPGALRRHSREAHALGVVASARFVTFVLPHLGGHIKPLALAIAAASLEGPEAMVTLHGDFSSDQVIVRDGAASLIDFDQASVGEPAVDLGTFIAQVRRDALTDQLDEHSVGALEDALLDGYDADLPRLDLQIAAALLRLAPHAFRDQHPAWPDLTERLVDAAHGAFARWEACQDATLTPVTSPA